MISAKPGEHLPALQFLEFVVANHVLEGALDKSFAEFGCLQIIDQLGSGHLIADAYFLPH